MFEAAISPCVADAGSPGALRTLDWGELVARLSAARDLRAIFARAAAAPASFAPLAASELVVRAHGERDVNPDALAAGKAPRATAFAHAAQAEFGDREGQ